MGRGDWAPREGFFPIGGCACGGAGPGPACPVDFQLRVPALVEVVWEVLLRDAFGFGTTDIEEELSLGRTAGGM